MQKSQKKNNVARKSLKTRAQRGFLLIQLSVAMAGFAALATVMVPNMIRTIQIKRVDAMARSMIGLADAAKIYYGGMYCEDAGGEPENCWPVGQDESSGSSVALSFADNAQLMMNNPLSGAIDRDSVQILPASTSLNTPYDSGVYGLNLNGTDLEVTLNGDAVTALSGKNIGLSDLGKALENRLKGKDGTATCDYENDDGTNGETLRCTASRFAAPSNNNGGGGGGNGGSAPYNPYNAN